jgi:alkaline phosphatase D
VNHPNLARLASIRVGRRRFLAGAGAVAGLVLAGRTTVVATRPTFSADPFSLGVASGDPLPDGVVLWTRLAPDPLNGGGMPPAAVPVGWQVASDDQMRTVVRSGTALATPDLAHSVHVDVRGLEPGRRYWYGFTAGDAESPIGRTRTAPAPDAPLNRLRFAYASCQNWEQGYYTAYRHLAAEDLDLVVHLGDYIYESTAPDRPRSHNGPRPTTLEEYRARHALYKTDPDLRAAHAAFPWVVTWDDHEVVNDYAGEIDPRNSPPERFRARRAAAYQAYWEHLPLRPSSMPNGPGMQLYRRLTFGNLAEFSVLDTRQYRTDQPCGVGPQPRCAGALDEAATLTGPD